MSDLFSNNAEGTLAAGISDSDTAITLSDLPGAYRFHADVDGDLIQRATITDADPDVFEIVYITANPGGLSLTVLRGQEGTDPVAWSAGAKISAKVTAGMLNDLAPKNGLEKDPLSDYGRQFRTTTNNGQFVVNGRVDASYRAVQFGGIPSLQTVYAATRNNPLDDGNVDLNLSHESFGGTAFVELGDTEPGTWTADQPYGQNAMVKPSTPTGYYYLLDLEPGNDYSENSTAPAFDEFGSCPEALGADDSVVGVWVAVPDPLVVKEAFPGGVRLLVTEVGFICTSYGASTAPVVSIGASDNPTLLANNVSLSQITDANQVHRIPISAGGAMHYNLVFSLETPATGTLKGRFYWRGLFVSV